MSVITLTIPYTRRRRRTKWLLYYIKESLSALVNMFLVQSSVNLISVIAFKISTTIPNYSMSGGSSELLCDCRRQTSKVIPVNQSVFTYRDGKTRTDIPAKVFLRLTSNEAMAGNGNRTYQLVKLTPVKNSKITHQRLNRKFTFFCCENPYSEIENKKRFSGVVRENS